MASFSISDIYALMNAAYSVAAKTTDKSTKEYWCGLAKELDRLANEMEEEHQKELMRRATK